MEETETTNRRVTNVWSVILKYCGVKIFHHLIAESRMSRKSILTCPTAVIVIHGYGQEGAGFKVTTKVTYMPSQKQRCITVNELARMREGGEWML